MTKEEREEYRKQQEAWDEAQIQSIIERGYSRKAAEIIYAKAWEEGHSFNYQVDVPQYIDEYIEFVESVNKTNCSNK